MRQQTKPFIVERKPSRKLKPDANKTLDLGKLDLTPQPNLHVEWNLVEATAAGGDDDRR